MDIFRALKRDQRRALHLAEQLCESIHDDSELLHRMLDELKNEIDAYSLSMAATLLRHMEGQEYWRRFIDEMARESQMLIDLAQTIQRPQESERLAALREIVAAHMLRCETEFFEQAKEALSMEERQKLGSKYLFLRNVAPLEENFPEPLTGTLH